VFEGLSVFVGGFDLEGIELVVGAEGKPDPDLLRCVQSLALQSLVRRESMETGEPRFSLLETLREFALERLAERETEAVEALWREIGDPWRVAWSLNVLGLVLVGEWGRKVEAVVESLRLWTRLGDKRGIATALLQWASLQPGSRLDVEAPHSEGSGVPRSL